MAGAKMDEYTDRTKDYLEDRFRETVGGIYFSHQPIYGYRSDESAGSNISRYMITRSILNALNEYDFETFIDIGAAEGYTAFLVRELFGAKVMCTDLSENACRMARDIYQIDARPADIHALPFADDAFDAVLCSETIEHVTDYRRAVYELLRITRNILIITVPHESVEEVEANIRNKVPHGHINYFETGTLDFLKQDGYSVTARKTLSPFLVVPRVIAEASKKEKPGFPYRLYNSFTPLLRRVFTKRSAIRISDLDDSFCRKLGKYGGITFVIEKRPAPRKKTFPGTISTKDFIDKVVPFFRT